MEILIHYAYMQITWYGLSCFKIITGDSTLLINPFEKEAGLAAPRGKADIVLVSDGAGREYYKESECFVIAGEGEYEVRGILVNGFSFFHFSEEKTERSTAYVFRAEGISVCHLDGVSKADAEGLLERAGEVDILMVPVGGEKTVNAEEAMAIVAEFEPRIVIPMYFKTPGLSRKLESPESFLKAMGAAAAEPVEKFTVKKKDLPQAETKVVLFSLNQ